MGLTVWRYRCISTLYEISFVKNAELGLGRRNGLGILKVKNIRYFYGTSLRNPQFHIPKSETYRSEISKNAPIWRENVEDGLNGICVSTASPIHVGPSKMVVRSARKNVSGNC